MRDAYLGLYISIYLCHQQPDSARETVPLRNCTFCFHCCGRREYCNFIFLQRHCFFRSSFLIFPIYTQNLINKGRFNLLMPIVHYELQCKQRYGSFQDGNTQELHILVK